MEEDAADFLTNANEDIGEGDHPERSSDVAETANFNLFRTIGKIVTNPASGTAIGGVATAVITGSTIGQVGVGGLAGLLDASLLFLMTAEPHIRTMIAATGSDLTWVGSLIDWVKRKRKSN